ncbi:hypothetical protein NOVO_04185 [Rickettsiales bacterium Ac37b]|nr:hypothetical protein NOVO_04185 [Rickettsiales bacterium Ac37b]
MALIENTLKKVCNEEVQSELVMTKEEYKLMDAQSRFQALICEKFRVGRDTIETIAGGRALPLPDTIDDIKYILDRSLMAMNIPPLCYIGNLLGGNAFTYVIGAFATDVAYKFYKDVVINANKEVDEMLPRGQKSLDLIEKISKELAKKYGSQLANIKDDKSLEFLADAAVERMMNHLFSHTGIIQKIMKKVDPKEWFNRIMDNDPVPLDYEKMLYEGIYKGESNNKKRFLYTEVVQGRYGKDWVADGILSKAGVMLEDGRIFGKVRDIEKYGCIIGTEDEVKNRGLSSINQRELSPELIDEINKDRDKQIHAQNKLENIIKPVSNQTCIHKQAIKPRHSSKALIAGLLVTGLSLLFWAFPEVPIIATLIPGALPLIANFVPGTFVSGIGISVWGLIGKVRNTDAPQNVNDVEKAQNIKDEPLELIVPFIKERVKGPSYVDLVMKSRDNSMQALISGS